MSSSRRLLAATALLAVALGALAPPSWAGPAAPAQDPSPPTSTPKPGEIVESWALAPTGSLDPNEAGNRPSLSYDLDPGATITDSVTLYNYGNVPLTFRIYATDAFNNSAGQFDLLPGTETPTDVGSWITMPLEYIDVPPRKQAVIPIVLKVPADATPGDHVGAILASSDAQGEGPDGATVSVDRRTGTRMYVRVAGDLVPELAIENVKTTYEPSLNPLSGTAKVTYRIQNRGNVRLGGSYRLSISGPFGVAKKRIAAEDLVELLPGEGVTLTAEFDNMPATVLAFTDVRVEPLDSDAGAELSVTSRRAITFAPPISLVLLVLAVWMALRARRAYRRHRAAATPTREDTRVLEPQQS